MGDPAGALGETKREVVVEGPRVAIVERPDTVGEGSASGDEGGDVVVGAQPLGREVRFERRLDHEARGIDDVVVAVGDVDAGIGKRRVDLGEGVDVRSSR